MIDLITPVEAILFVGLVLSIGLAIIATTTSGSKGNLELFLGTLIAFILQWGIAIVIIIILILLMALKFIIFGD